MNWQCTGGTVGVHVFYIGMVVMTAIVANGHDDGNGMRRLIGRRTVFAQTAATLHIHAIRCDSNFRFEASATLLTLHTR